MNQDNNDLRLKINCSTCGESYLLMNDHLLGLKTNLFRCKKCHNYIKIVECPLCHKYHAIGFIENSRSNYELNCYNCNHRVNFSIPVTTSNISSTKEIKNNTDQPDNKHILNRSVEQESKLAIKIDNTTQAKSPAEYLFLLSISLHKLFLSSLFGIFIISIIAFFLLTLKQQGVTNNWPLTPLIIFTADSLLLTFSIFIFLYVQIIASNFRKFNSSRFFSITLFSLLMPVIIKLVINLFYAIPNIRPLYFYLISFPMYLSLLSMIVLMFWICIKFPFIESGKQSSIKHTIKIFINNPISALAQILSFTVMAAFVSIICQLVCNLLAKFIQFILLPGSRQIFAGTSLLSLNTPMRLLNSITPEISLLQMPVKIALLANWFFMASILFSLVVVISFTTEKISRKYLARLNK